MTEKKADQASYEYAKEVAGVNGQPSAIANLAIAYNAYESESFGKEGASAFQHLYADQMGNATIRGPDGEENHLAQLLMSEKANQGEDPYDITFKDMGKTALGHYQNILSQLNVPDLVEGVGGGKNKVSEKYNKPVKDLFPNWPKDKDGNYDQKAINKMSVGQYQELENQDKYVSGLLGKYIQAQTTQALENSLPNKREGIVRDLESMVSEDDSGSKKAA